MQRRTSITFLGLAIAAMLFGGSCQNTDEVTTQEERAAITESSDPVVVTTPAVDEPVHGAADENEPTETEPKTSDRSEPALDETVKGNDGQSLEKPLAAKPPVADPPVKEEPANAKPVESLIQPFPHVRVNLTTREVQFDAMVCLTEGWLEQVVCKPNSREHETLMVTDVRPSNLHAAMLLAKYEAGSPGRWKYEDETYSVVPPTGTAVNVFVRYENEAGEEVEHPVNQWVRDHLGRHKFPDRPWVFGGSQIAPNPEFMGPGEHYVADMTGSVIGLVTFGDELLGWREVLSDQAAVSPPEWEANGRAMPPAGTPVTVILRPIGEVTND